MSAKHFLSDPTALVAGALKAVTIINPAVVLDVEQKVLRHICSDDQPSRISIISGGGSGHEPAFGAYVGEGLLTASVAGTIFASPSSRQIQHAISKVDSSKGVLVTVMNYTGDVLNFGVAVEKARVQNPEMKIDMLVVGDDVGVPCSQAGKVGRRGIAGTVLVHKITGALAAAGYDLSTIVQVGKLVCQNLVTVGASLDRVHVPGQDEGTEHSLAAGEIELGMGIHNEAGSGRKSGQDAKLPTLVDEMLRQLLDPSDDERAFLANRTESMVLLINNLGGLSVLELGSITTEIVDRLHSQYNINLARVFVGTFMTSLNGPGFSITLLNVVPSSLNVGLLELLDAPCEAPGWSAPVRTATWARETRNSTSVVEETKSISPLPLVPSQLIFDELALAQALKRGLQRLIDVEPDVTHFDTVVGDGDCGTTLKRGAQGMKHSPDIVKM
jgi:dihydroxyacetone kinase